MTIINFSMHIYQSTDSNCKFLYDTILNELNIQGSAGFILVILKCGILISESDVWSHREFRTERATPIYIISVVF